MKKKKWFMLLWGIIGLLLLVIAALWVLTVRGFGFSVGRCLIADNGAYMLIEGNGPVVMSNRTGKENLFANLETGDKIFVLHDGVNESYPGGTGAYVILKLGNGDISDIPEQVLTGLSELGWVCGVESQTNMEEEIPCVSILEGSETNGEDATEANRVFYSHGTTNMSINIPEGWEYEINEYTEGSSSYGISFWPIGETEGKLKFLYYEAFGVCGTGLSQEIIKIGDYEASKGTFYNSKVWDFISFRIEPRGYVILNEGADKWLAERIDEAMAIIETIRIGEEAFTE